MLLRTKIRDASLTPEIDAFISNRIASSRFRGASEVVHAALRLPGDEERRQEAPERRTGSRERRVGR